jgi:hypothetical protein
VGAIENIFRHAQNPLAVLAAQGRVFDFAASAINTTATGTTTLANTSPSFLLDIPVDITCIPVYASLQQAGTVAGAAITVIMEKDNADRYTSGGTAMTIYNDRGRTIPDNGAATPLSPAFYSTIGSAIVATNAYGIQMWAPLVGQDVSPAEGVTNELVWTPPAGAPDFLIGPAAWIVNTNAGTTGPTWNFAFKVAVFRTSEL